MDDRALSMTKLMDELEEVLNGQLALIGRGEMSDEMLKYISRAEELAGEIKAGPKDKKIDLEKRLGKLKSLNRKLCLALSAEKAETGRKLLQVRTGKKTLNAYKGDADFSGRALSGV
jgi:ribosomal protein L10